MAKKQKDLSPKSMALMGGKATFKKYGREHYVEMVEARWKKYRKAQRAVKKV